MIIWTNNNGEGENICFEIIDVCRKVKSDIPVYRAIFSEITKETVRQALDNLLEPNQRQSEAVDVRRELEFRTGAVFTRFQTMILRELFPKEFQSKIVSYGACQMPTLGFITRRSMEIEKHQSPLKRMYSLLIHLNININCDFEPKDLDGSTIAPSRITEADLVDLMDKHGIGTDGTYADHINAIKARGYVDKIGEYLVPSRLGMA